MSSLSKLSISKKGSKESNVRVCEDRFTNLPCSLVSKILSCLPTKEAVATSVLSTRWNQSWTSITNLDFDDKLSEDAFDSIRDAPTFRKFTDFVTRVLLLREKSCLQSVRLKCFRNYDDSLISAWLIAIIQCNVQDLDFTISIPDEHPLIRLPSDIFLCSTLVVLKLEVRSCVTIPSSTCLTRLKTLHLTKVQLANDVSITNLMSGCPVLEELRLCKCRGEDLRVVNIISPVLKKLTIEDLLFEGANEDYQIIIDTPALEYLTIRDYLSLYYIVNELDHLIEAVIDCDNIYTCEDEVDEINTQAIKDVLNGISQVHKLVLSRDSVWVINRCNVDVPKFNNLTYLKLHTGHDDDWLVLAELVKNSPYLETLCIQLGDGGGLNDFLPDPLPFRRVPSCFHSHLKEIELGYFCYFEEEMKFVEYILKNANVLEMLTFRVPFEDGDAERKSDFLTELLFCPRASSICKVVVLDYVPSCVVLDG